MTPQGGSGAGSSALSAGSQQWFLKIARMKGKIIRICSCTYLLAAVERAGCDVI